MNADVFRVYPCSEGDGRYKCVVRGRLNGKYVRKYFAKRTDAATWAETKNIEALNQGVEHVDFPTDLRMQATLAAKLLKPHGVSLIDAVRIAMPIIAQRAKSLPVKEAFERFMDDYRLHGGPKKAISSASYLDYLHDMLTPFVKFCGEHLVADVGIAEIEEFLSSRKKAGAVTRQSYIRAISAFYSWCVRASLRLENPLAKLRKKLPKGEVSILSVADAEKVLQSASKEELGFLSLAMFCGIRIAEFRKQVRDTRGKEREVSLNWTEVDLHQKQVFIPPELDKNQNGRYVDIPANAVAWLAAAIQPEGAIVPDNWKDRRVLLEKRSDVALPQNVFRHSFCSYRIALDQDYAKAAALVGNSPAMLRRHYVRVLPRKLGHAFFSIRPRQMA